MKYWRRNDQQVLTTRQQAVGIFRAGRYSCMYANVCQTDASGGAGSQFIVYQRMELISESSTLVYETSHLDTFYVVHFAFAF